MKKAKEKNSRPEDEFAIRIAVLADMHGWLGSPEAAVFISIWDHESRQENSSQDPEDALLLELFALDIDARPVSESRMIDGFYVDSATGEKTYNFCIHRVGWAGKNLASVVAMFIQGVRSGLMFRYSMQCDKSNWKIVKRDGIGMM